MTQSSQNILMVWSRAHTPVRLLRQHGFDAADLSSGFTTFRRVSTAAAR